MEKFDDSKGSSPGSRSIDEEEQNEVESTGRMRSSDELLMDWEKGLVGWESETDPYNPLCVTLPQRGHELNIN
jgi:hypothetical protein